MLELLEKLLGVNCESEEARRRPFTARLCVFKVFADAAYERGLCLSYREILERYRRGFKGHLPKVLDYLVEAGLLERRGEVYCVSRRAVKLLDPDPPHPSCPRLFLAGNDVALKVAVESGLRPLNWLLSAGRYWKGSGFRGYERDLAYVRRLHGALFVDSGAQQFYAKFKGYIYPYSPREYLSFAAEIGADLIATLDLPLDILAPRGLSVGEGIRITVELGVEVISEAERMGLLERVVPVLQGYSSPEEWLESLDLYKEHGVIPGRFRLWGLGSLCMARSYRLTLGVVEAVRKALGPEAGIHVFGVNLSHLKRVYTMINSYDTAAWVYWAKMDGAALVWSPRRKSFIHLQARDGRRYDTETLLDLNLRQIISMHMWLCNSMPNIEIE